MFIIFGMVMIGILGSILIWLVLDILYGFCEFVYERKKER